MTATNPFQDHFDRMAEQYRDAVTEAARGWSEAAQRLTGPTTSQPEVSAIIDGAFDLAELHLRTQREFTKGILELYVRGAAATANSVSSAAPADESGLADNDPAT